MVVLIALGFPFEAAIVVLHAAGPSLRSEAVKKSPEDVAQHSCLCAAVRPPFGTDGPRLDATAHRQECLCHSTGVWISAQPLRMTACVSWL